MPDINLVAKRPRTSRAANDAAYADPRTHLIRGDVVIYKGHRRVIGRYLTRGTTGRDFSRTCYVLQKPKRARDPYSLEWVDWRDIKLPAPKRDSLIVNEQVNHHV